MIYEADAPMLTDHLKNLSGMLMFTASLLLARLRG